MFAINHDGMCVAQLALDFINITLGLFRFNYKSKELNLISSSRTWERKRGNYRAINFRFFKQPALVKRNASGDALVFLLAPNLETTPAITQRKPWLWKREPNNKRAGTNTSSILCWVRRRGFCWSSKRRWGTKHCHSPLLSSLFHMHFTLFSNSLLPSSSLLLCYI